MRKYTYVYLNTRNLNNKYFLLILPIKLYNLFVAHRIYLLNNIEVVYTLNSKHFVLILLLDENDLFMAHRIQCKT